MENLLHDLRYAFRTLRRDAGFAFSAILLLGLGIASNTAVFSVVQALLLRPLPFREPDRLVWIANFDPEGIWTGLSTVTSRVATFEEWRRANRSFEDLAAYNAFFARGSYTMTGESEPQRLTGVEVDPQLFPLLGIEPLMGRQFTLQESVLNGPRAALLSYSFWQSRFAADPGVLGRSITLNGEPVEVVGVMPAGFDFDSLFSPATPVHIFLPLVPDIVRNWGNTISVIGRLKPGVELSAAQAEFDAITRGLQDAHPEWGRRYGARLSSLQEQIRGPVRRALFVLWGAVVAVLLMVSANLSNLLLARSSVRRRELGVRTALGAGRIRIVRQLLTESLLLAGFGTALGLGLAWLGVRLLARSQAIAIPLLESVRIDAATLGYALLVTLAAGMAAGLIPALRITTGSFQEILRQSGRQTREGGRSGWLRSSLVVSQVAMACMLLVGAGLLMHSFARLLEVDLGFRPENVVTLRLDPSRDEPPAQRTAYLVDLVERVRTLPGVSAAAVTDALPLDRNRSWTVRAKGRSYEATEVPNAFVRIVGEGYLKTMGIPLLEGRDFTSQDKFGNKPVMLVNQTMARTLWPEGDPIGKIVLLGPEIEVAGVVSDVRHSSLEEGAGLEFYLPITQIPSGSCDLVVRSTLATEPLIAGLRSVLEDFDPELPRSDFRPLQYLVDRAVSPRRFFMSLLGGFALLALILASLGIYAVVSCSVNQRRQEIGIRMALGASAKRVQLGVIRQTLVVVSLGMGLGAAGALALTRLLNSLLFGISSTDPVAFLGTGLTLTLVALCSALLPARRAARTDPLVALRSS